MKQLYCVTPLLILLLISQVVYSQDRQTEKRMASGFGYLELLPPDYNSSTKQYPAIIFLHGSGERGDGSPTQLQRVKSNGPPQHIRNGHNMCFTVNGQTECFIVLSPQTNKWTWKNDVVPFVKEALTQYRIDPNRVCVTGLSMGGEGTWYTASYADNNPNLFAAIAPMAARAELQDGINVANKKIAVWAHHGDRDNAMSLASGQLPITGMLQANANPKPIFTIYPGGDHGGGWIPAYRTDRSVHNPNVYEWFLMQRRHGSSSPITVTAGGDKAVTLPTTAISIQATASGATVQSYAWSKVSGPNATLQNTNARTMSVNNVVAGTYKFRVVVTSTTNASASDEMTLVVNPAATTGTFTVSAGADKTITLPTASTTFQATATSQGTTISSYSWTKISGPSISLWNDKTNRLSVSGAVAGTYIFRVTARDNNNRTATSDVRLIVNAAGNSNNNNGGGTTTPPPPTGSAPVVSAGADKTITLPTASTTFYGTATVSSGSVSSYSWTKVSGPSISMWNTDKANLSVSNAVAGSYVFRLTVRDNQNRTASSDVRLTVQSAAANNKPPVVSAGADKTISLPTSSTTFYSTASDPDGSIAKYQWTKVSGPAASLWNTDKANMSASGLVAGTYVFRVTVTDNQNAQASSEVRLTVRAAATASN